MLKSNFKTWTMALFALFAVALTSCDKDKMLEAVNIQSFTDSTISDFQGDAVGKGRCLEFIFPVSVAFTDGTSASADDYEGLYTSIKSWFETNGLELSRKNKPSLVFPIQVLNEEAEIIDVASQEELKSLRRECGDRFDRPRNKGKCNKGKGHHCFKLVFPISVNIGGEVQSFEDRAALKAAAKAYKETAGEDAERPELVFPITVEDEDGNQATVASKEDLQALKETCGDED